MDPLLSAATGGISGLVEGGIDFFTGLSQKKKAEQIAKNNPFIPEQLPGEVKKATQLAAQNYTNGMPGMTAEQQAIQQNAGNAQAAAARGASSSGDVLDSANKINVQSQDATLQLAMQAASYKSNALGGYEAALDTQSKWQDKLYQNNELQPYLRSANTAASLYGAGSTNEFKGIDTALEGVQTGVEDFSNAGGFNKRGSSINPVSGGVPGISGATQDSLYQPINTNQLISASMYNLNP